MQAGLEMVVVQVQLLREVRQSRTVLERVLESREVRLLESPPQ